MKNIDYIDYIDLFMKHNQQFPDSPDDSQLWKSIQNALKCSDEEAQEAAKFHCNSLSFYALCRAHDWIMFHYSTWVERLVASGFMTLRGYINKDKISIAQMFGFNDKLPFLSYFYDYDKIMNKCNLNPDKGYNIKVYSNSNKNNLPGGGEHFMAGYILNRQLYLSDSSKRGIRVLAKDVIPKHKFQWVLEV